MPSPIEEIAIKDLLRHPKLVVLYAVCCGLGWLINRVIPDECQKQNNRLEIQNERLLRRGDSLQASKDELYNELLHEKGVNQEQHKTIKTIDSMLVPMGSKAKQILKEKKP